jgi:hypothetical protein
VIARRRSPEETVIKAEITSGSTAMFSRVAMCESRAAVEAASRGVKRNLEQRDARGSMILGKPRSKSEYKAHIAEELPSHIIANETESCNPGI